MTDLIKQDINFLDKPLWFVDLRPIGIGFIWTDIDGFEYRTAYKLPDKFDNLILFYLLMKSQANNYAHIISLSKYEILKGCNFLKGEHYYSRIEDSLKRWQNIAVNFTGSFYEQGKHITIGFGVLDNYTIDKNTAKIHIQLNENWILKIKNSQFFKLINFEYYKALKRPVSRRLYELLCKNFKGRNECFYKLTSLGVRLTISGRKTKKGNEAIFASDVLVAIKPAINEINKLAQTPKIDELTGIPREDIFTLKYRIEGEKQERVIHLEKVPAFADEPVKDMPTTPQLPPEMPIIVPEVAFHPTLEACVSQAKRETPQTPQEQDTEKQIPLPYQLETQYNEFVLWLQETSPDFNFKTLQHIDREEIAAYFPKLKSKIEFDLGKGKVDNVSGYILECLRNKWDIPLSSKEAKRKREEEIRQQEQQQRQAENERQAKIEAEAKRFKEMVGSIDSEVKEKLWQEADAMTPKNMPGNLHVAITYSNLLLKYVNENMDANLMPEAADSLKVVKAVALHKPGWKPDKLPAK